MMVKSIVFRYFFVSGLGIDNSHASLVLTVEATYCDYFGKERN
jgi:hypothetical protein